MMYARSSHYLVNSGWMPFVEWSNISLFTLLENSLVKRFKYYILNLAWTPLSEKFPLCLAVADCTDILQMESLLLCQEGHQTICFLFSLQVKQEYFCTCQMIEEIDQFIGFRLQSCCEGWAIWWVEQRGESLGVSWWKQGFLDCINQIVWWRCLSFVGDGFSTMSQAVPKYVDLLAHDSKNKS